MIHAGEDTVLIPQFVKCLNYWTFPGPFSLGDYWLLWFNDHYFAKASQISYLEPWPGYLLYLLHIPEEPQSNMPSNRFIYMFSV